MEYKQIHDTKSCVQLLHITNYMSVIIITWIKWFQLKNSKSKTAKDTVACDSLDLFCTKWLNIHIYNV